MRLTTKGKYAIIGILDLLNHTDKEPIRIQDIATRQNLSIHYLEQLFAKLRKNGVVKSIKGPKGGYLLAQKANKITIKCIFDYVNEDINLSDIESHTKERKISQNYFQNLEDIIQNYLKNSSLKDLIKLSEINQRNFISVDNENIKDLYEIITANK